MATPKRKKAHRETKADREERMAALEQKERAQKAKAEARRKSAETTLAAFRKAGVVKVESCDCCCRVWVRSYLGNVHSADS